MSSASDSPEMEDCLGCRLTGSATLLGVGAYFFNERSKLPRHDLGQRRWLFACAGTFAAAGIWRATTHLFETSRDAATVAATEGTSSAWYDCKGCNQKARAWFGLQDEKPTQEQHRHD